MSSKQTEIADGDVDGPVKKKQKVEKAHDEMVKILPVTILSGFLGIWMCVCVYGCMSVRRCVYACMCGDVWI